MWPSLLERGACKLESRIREVFLYILFVAICTDSCKGGAFWCNNHQCISSSDHCNRIQDCTDGSDESGCNTPITSSPTTTIGSTTGSTIGSTTGSTSSKYANREC